MLSQILRIPSGYIDSVNDPVIGQAATPGGTGISKFAGQLGMEVELTQSMIKLKTPSVPVGPGKFMYVRLALTASSPAVGATVNWDAGIARHLYTVTTAAGTAAGTVLTPNVTPGNYTIIQTAALPPTGVITPLTMEGEAAADEGEMAGAAPAAKSAAATRTPATKSA